MNLILGASGKVESRVGRHLLNRGEPVRAVSRNPSRIAELVRMGAEPVQGDLRTTGWMSAALEGCGPDNLSRLQVLATIEPTPGCAARRTHVPVIVLRAMRLLAGPFHPGIRYLLDVALAESTMPDDPSWVPRAFDWTGPTTVLQVVQHWAALDAGGVC